MSHKTPSETWGESDSSGEADPAASRRREIKHSLGRVLRLLVFGQDPSALVELPLLQVRCLHIIRRHEGLKMQELAAKVEATLPAVSQIADRLVKRGLVERRSDPLDRRVVRLHLTEEATDLLHAAHERREARLHAALSEMDAVDEEKVLEGLRLLKDAAMRSQPERMDFEQRLEALMRQEEGTPAEGGGDPLVEMLAARDAARRAGGERDVEVAEIEQGEGNPEHSPALK